MSRTNFRALQSKYMAALSRPELRLESVARVSPDSPMSMPIKAEDPEIRQMIDAALARKIQAVGPSRGSSR